MSLTKYREGSLREMWCIAFPLMLSSLSVMAMLFVDRLLLAHYSTAAMNAAANATTLGWAFLVGWMVMTSIAEVFVAQYNGAGRKEKLGEPVWQMMWLALFSIVFFVPLAIWGAELFYGSSPEMEMARNYFTWMMAFGPSAPVYGALCSFFVGQGKTSLVTTLAIVANIVNAALDVVLIFGIEGYIPSMGVTGAAIATTGSLIFQSACLAYFFLKKSNRENHGTGKWQIDLPVMWQCIKIGIPGALFDSIEILGWAAFYYLMTVAGERYITIAGICQSITILFLFFAEGVRKATSTIVGNLIGARRHSVVSEVILSGIKLHAIFFVVLVIILMSFAHELLEQFLPMAAPEVIEKMRDPMVISLIGVSLYLFLEGLRMLFAGALTAAGDTIFLLIGGSLSVWLLLVMPAYFVVVKGQAPIAVAIYLWVFYSLAAALLYGYRYIQGKWKAITLIATS
jgi:MATE family multidrug resistance protein